LLHLAHVRVYFARTFLKIWRGYARGVSGFFSAAAGKVIAVNTAQIAVVSFVFI
jgi:hypothetical protein